MSAQFILYLLIGFVLLEALVSGVLSWLNGTWMSHPIPAVLEGLYDEEKYEKQQAYMKANRRVGRIGSIVSTVITVVFLACGLFGWLDNLFKSVTDSVYGQICLFALFLQLFGTLVELPFSYYSTFVIEERFGFNKTTHRTFWLDALKGFILSYVLTAGLVCVIYWLYDTIGDGFWLWATGVCVVFIVFFSMFYSNLIVPLFNKQKPLEQGELRSAIEGALQSMNCRFKDIYVIDGSKHSTKANAYFTGFGPKKRIVLYDTLIEQLTTEEVVAVLAHEVGHYRHHDTLKNMFTSIVTVGVYLYVFSLMVSSPLLPEALGGTAPSFVLSMVAFSQLLTPISLVLDPLMNSVLRRAEYAADRYANAYGHGNTLISGLKKLSAHALSNLTPHPAFVRFSYSHPTLAQRIISIQENQKKL